MWSRNTCNANNLYIRRLFLKCCKCYVTWYCMVWKPRTSRLTFLHRNQVQLTGSEFISTETEFDPQDLSSSLQKLSSKRTQILCVELDSCGKKWASVASVVWTQIMQTAITYLPWWLCHTINWHSLHTAEIWCLHIHLWTQHVKTNVIICNLKLLIGVVRNSPLSGLERGDTHPWVTLYNYLTIASHQCRWWGIFRLGGDVPVRKIFVKTLKVIKLVHALKANDWYFLFVMTWHNIWYVIWYGFSGKNIFIDPLGIS